jgi:hypothetical protein
MVGECLLQTKGVTIMDIFYNRQFTLCTILSLSLSPLTVRKCSRQSRNIHIAVVRP